MSGARSAASARSWSAAVASLYSFETAIALLAALYVLDILALWLLIPERRGVALS